MTSQSLKGITLPLITEIFGYQIAKLLLLIFGKNIPKYEKHYGNRLKIAMP
jgi:hypothetical protein